MAGPLDSVFITGHTKVMKDKETMTIGDLFVRCIETPGHTGSHVSYTVSHIANGADNSPFLFCADTFFIAGCGRLLGGSAE